MRVDGITMRKVKHISSLDYLDFIYETAIRRKTSYHDAEQYLITRYEFVITEPETPTGYVALTGKAPYSETTYTPN